MGTGTRDWKIGQLMSWKGRVCHALKMNMPKCSQMFNELKKKKTEGLNSTVICTTLGKCGELVYMVEQLQNPMCEFCTDLMGNLSMLLQSNVTQGLISGILYGICKQMHTNCDVFINGKLNTYLYSFSQGEAFKWLCGTAFGACPLLQTPNYMLQNLLTCGECLQMMAFAKNVTATAASQQSLKARLQAICDLSSLYSSKCKGRIDSLFSVYMMQVQIGSPEQLCQTLQICPNCALNNTVANFNVTTGTSLNSTTSSTAASNPGN
ncbi:hypothetical protein P879_05741 [Paragonimus westermani]|uniref:Saposin B-type domain-containing protein n=1 Tax=Paragonimus westermani TaxID=34504 RepID=A0A8T0DJR5_9TREM|nr:hypothetical protein P879_05741 [Paragonimus westermani]